MVWGILGSVLLELRQMKLVVLLQFSKFPCSTVYSLPVLLYCHSVELVSQARPNQPQRGWLGLLQLNWKLIPQDTFTQRYSPDLSSRGQKGLGSRLSGLSLFLENMNSANWFLSVITALLFTDLTSSAFVVELVDFIHRNGFTQEIMNLSSVLLMSSYNDKVAACDVTGAWLPVILMLQSYKF